MTALRRILSSLFLAVLAYLAVGVPLALVGAPGWAVGFCGLAAFLVTLPIALRRRLTKSS